MNSEPNIQLMLQSNSFNPTIYKFTNDDVTYAQAELNSSSSPEMKLMERIEGIKYRIFDIKKNIMEKLCK